MAAGVGAVVAVGTLLGLVAGAIYLRARSKATGFGFSVFQVGLSWGMVRVVYGSCSGLLTTYLSPQAEDEADDDFSPWQEGTSPTLVSVPNPIFGSHDAFCEPFNVSVGDGGNVEVDPWPDLGPAPHGPLCRTHSWRRTSLTPSGFLQSSDTAEARAGETRPLYCPPGQMPSGRGWGAGLFRTIKVPQRMWAMSLRKGVFMQPVQSWSIQSGASCCRGVRRG